MSYQNPRPLRPWFPVPPQTDSQNPQLPPSHHDVLHALKKYPVRAIEDGIAYIQKQKWSNAKAGVFVNFLKKWNPNEVTNQEIKSESYTSYAKSKSTASTVKTFLMSKFPEIANGLSQEQNPIDEATYNYLQRLRVAGLIHDTHYNTIKNFFGVLITIKDYLYPIPWWDAMPQLYQLYPDFS